jgi:hypothetical protein
MSYYRLFFRDDHGHFSGCREFEAPDEAHAMGRADRMCRGLNRELWRDGTFLRRWEDGAGDLSFERPDPTAYGVLRAAHSAGIGTSRK